jgi:ubiquitin carboxyl-terminal hydrolase 7
MTPLHIFVSSSIHNLRFENADEYAEKRLEEEAAEREARKKEREESHLYLNVRIITDDTYRVYGGTDLTVFDVKHEVDPSAARHYRQLKKCTVQQLVEKVAEDIGTDPKRLRLWCMVNRQNKTVRPDVPMVDTSMTIEEAHLKLAGTKSPELRLWAEVAEEVTPEGDAIWPTYQLLPNGTAPKTDLIVLFLKYFDIEQQTLTGVGYIYISREKKVEELVPVISKKMGWAEKSPGGEKLQLKLFEVS